MTIDWPDIRLSLSRPSLAVFNSPLGTRMELGRQKVTGQGGSEVAEPAPFALVPQDDGERIVIARRHEVHFSRNMLLLERLGPTTVVVTNVSKTQTVKFIGENVTLGPGQSREIDLQRPHSIQVADLVVGLAREDQEALGESHLASLEQQTMAPNFRPLQVRSPRDLDTLSPMARDIMLGWISETVALLNSAAYSEDFIQSSIESVCGLLELDTAAYLEFQAKQPVVVYQHQRDPSAQHRITPSQRMLERALQERKTFWEIPPDSDGSLMAVGLAIVAPILSAEGEAVGALYGARRAENGKGFSDVLTRLFDMMAHCIAVGLARLKKEKVALDAERELSAQRSRFEQFFSPQVVDRLAAQQQLLEARDAEITVLYCDICGFTRTCERLAPDLLLEWLQASLELVSECILETDGVVDKYVGDEVIGLWGAPEIQPDHADRACRAWRILERLGEFSRRWEERIGRETDVRIGINSGTACVGNIGSTIKFQYGAIGNTMNLGSRIQGVARQLQTSVVIGQATHAKLTMGIARRLCPVLVTGSEQPMDVYELPEFDEQRSASLRMPYEEALRAFEASDFAHATKILGALVNDFPQDGPSRVLLMRSVQALTYGPEKSHPIWQLDMK